MADDDLGFVCKACGRFYADSDVTEWDSQWAIRDGERWITDVIHRCPLCGSTCSHDPNEAALRFQVEDGPRPPSPARCPSAPGPGIAPTRDMTNLISLWPQERIQIDSFVTISMDITAAFLGDMGMAPNGLEPLRQAFRESIGQEPDVVASGGPPGADAAGWLERLDSLLQRKVPDSVRQQFYTWLADTYTFVPADRPNWERYEMFFFQWSVGMRTGEDNAGCFPDPHLVYQAYDAFIPARQLKRRIQESRRRPLSQWDERMFSLRRYTLDEEEEDSGECFDPFGVVDSTANRNYFQQFWEYLFPRLSEDYRRRLYEAMWEYYQRTSVLTELLPPDHLTRSAR